MLSTFPGQAVGFDLWVPCNVDAVAELKNLQSTRTNTLAVGGCLCYHKNGDVCVLLGGGLENSAY